MRLNRSAVLTAVFTLGWMFSQASVACSCTVSLPSDVQAVDLMWQEARLIFVGKVRASLLPNLRETKRRFRFDVQENFKGARTPSVLISSALSSAECGTKVAVGKTYLVVAYGAGDPMISICDQPIEVEFASARLMLLRERRMQHTD